MVDCLSVTIVNCDFSNCHVCLALLVSCLSLLVNVFHHWLVLAVIFKHVMTVSVVRAMIVTFSTLIVSVIMSQVLLYLFLPFLLLSVVQPGWLRALFSPTQLFADACYFFGFHWYV